MSKNIYKVRQFRQEMQQPPERMGEGYLDPLYALCKNHLSRAAHRKGLIDTGIYIDHLDERLLAKIKKQFEPWVAVRVHSWVDEDKRNLVYHINVNTNPKKKHVGLMDSRVTDVERCRLVLTTLNEKLFAAEKIFDTIESCFAEFASKPISLEDLFTAEEQADE